MKRMIIGTLVVTLGLSALLFVAGCATMWRGVSVDIVVDSIASDRAGQHRRYILLPGIEGVTEEDLQFQEFARYVRRALRIRGFQPAERAEDADVVIVLSYGISDPQTHQYTYSLPVWGQTGVSSSHTSGTIQAFGNVATFSGTTTYTRSYGITGYSTHVASVTTYSRYALMTAYDLADSRATKKSVQLWKTTIMSGGTSGDLRWIFPLLVSAAAPLLGSNTGHQVWVRFDESDEAAREAVRAILGLKPEKDVAVCVERVRETKGTAKDYEEYPHKLFDASVRYDSHKPTSWLGVKESRLLFEKCLAEKGWTLE